MRLLGLFARDRLGYLPKDRVAAVNEFSMPCDASRMAAPRSIRRLPAGRAASFDVSSCSPTSSG
jgi:hypothetical protein